MSLFGAIIGAVIETVKLPVAVAKDIVTMGGTLSDQNPTGQDQSYTMDALDKIKDEASK